MYTVSKGPSKIVAKTRRGVAQNFDRLENSRENSRRSTDLDNESIASVPKPTFHNISKRPVQSNRESNFISPQHEEIIKYIHDSWVTVCHQYHRHYSLKESTNNNVQSIVYYNDGEKSAMLQDFKPFDLESWWGKRIFNSITNTL